MRSFRIGVWGPALLLLASIAQHASTVSVDEAILSDIMTSFVGHEASTCITADTASSTSFTFDWPGSSDPTSEWYPAHVGFEQDLFQAAMSHDDGSGRRSWTIRIGTGGNMYSHYAPDLHGESMAPQAHGDAPWIDEVQQQVAVNNNLNNQAPWNRPYFHHQAGAYQRDGSYTTVPFYSPSFARHCAGNMCTFASWGTQAHVPTPFTAPVMFITRYTNCGSGVIELTQAMHNFAEVASGTSVDQNYFNVGWGGVRASRLPFALEANSSKGSSTDSLDFVNPDYVDTMGQCPWQVSHSSPGQMTNLDQTPGYTAFATSGLLSNGATLPELPCRDNSISCITNVGGCMVTSCTDAQVSSGSHTRVALRVSPGSTPNCGSHSFTFTREGVTYPGMKCDLRDTGFGRNHANSCEPWARYGFKRMDTGAVLEVAYVKHWTWNSGDEDTFLAIYEEDAATARSTFNSFFDNTADTVNNLDIEVVLMTTTSLPAGYNPGVTESAFTYVYGRGEDYSQLPSPNAGDGSVTGTSRRRWGTSDRDYTVFTVNWLGQSRLKPGQTYINRSFQFASELGAVEALGEDLRDKVYVDQVEEVDYNARRVDLYKDGDRFEAVAASNEGGPTSCGSDTAVVACSGWWTPQSGKSPFFYITCGTNTHVGQDPYHFSPSFGDTFPGHAPAGETVRSYVCDGQSNTVRPTWKLLGFFSPDCAGIGSATLDDSVCPDIASPSTQPTQSPTTQSPTTLSPTTQSPTTQAPTTSSPTTQSPTTQAPTTLSPTTQSPITQAPTTSSPTTRSPTESPTTQSPTTHAPTTTSPTTQSPATQAPSTQSPNTPSKSPTQKPTQSPTLKGQTTPPSIRPTTSPSSSPSTKPSSSPTPVPKIDVVLKGSVSIENVTSRRRLASNLPEGFIDAFQDSLCAHTGYNDCITTVTKINGQSVGRVRGRQLQSSIILIEFETIIKIICDAGCSTNPQAIETLANSVYQQASSDLQSAITSAVLIDSISAASSDIANLLANANISGDFSQVVVPLLALLNWYPDWSGGSNTCKNDINSAPMYMRLNTMYFENSLEACCKRHYSWAYNECAGENTVTPSGYFPNWGGISGTAHKCLNDSDLMPEYIQNNPASWLLDSVEKCCARYFSWAYNDCIVATSGGSATVTGSLRWYLDGGICTQDCAEDGALCGGFANPWNELFDSASACCTGKLSWMPQSTCVAQSTKLAVISSGQWFVDWSIYKCVKDCDNAADVDCGGIANTYDQLHDSSGACCEQLWYVDDCTKSSSRKGD